MCRNQHWVSSLLLKHNGRQSRNNPGSSCKVVVVRETIRARGRLKIDPGSPFDLNRA